MQIGTGVFLVLKLENRLRGEREGGRGRGDDKKKKEQLPYVHSFALHRCSYITSQRAQGGRVRRK
jgi:hypothetical protein